MDWRTTMHANGLLNIFQVVYICIIPGKLSENNLHAWLSSNPCGQVLKRMKSRGPIHPILLRRKRTFSHRLENNHSCKWILDKFPGIIRKSALLENCQNPFANMVTLQSMWKGCNHCWNFMESGSESATYEVFVSS